MDQIFQLFLLKTSEVQQNLLDLMSTIIDYEKSLESGLQKASIPDNKVLINKTVFQTIREFLPKVTQNMNHLSQIIDKNFAQNERLNEQLIRYKKREITSNRQLQEVRSLYRNLKEEMDWKEICEQESIDSGVDNSREIEELNQLSHYLKTSLDLIMSSSHNQRTVTSFMENEEVFKDFMSNIRNIFNDYINELMNSCPNTETRIDHKLIETIYGICVNVFQCNDYSGEDIPQWIDSFVTLQALDKRFFKVTITALHNICFSPNGTEELQKKSGIIELLAKCLTDEELKHEYKVKINAVKVIRILIETSKDTKLQFNTNLYKDFIRAIRLDNFRQMVINEKYLTLGKAMSLLLKTLNDCSTHCDTED